MTDKKMNCTSNKAAEVELAFKTMTPETASTLLVGVRNQSFMAAISGDFVTLLCASEAMMRLADIVDPESARADAASGAVEIAVNKVIDGFKLDHVRGVYTPEQIEHGQAHVKSLRIMLPLAATGFDDYA